MTCEHCRQRDAVIGLSVQWRPPIMLCALCYKANETSLKVHAPSYSLGSVV